jgi:heme exporter protein A
MIEVRSLGKTFGLRPVLHGLDLDVARGEFVALVGPNGAGKTTLLRILATLTRPGRGAVRIAGFGLPDHAAEVRQRIGVVSHLPLLYGDLTAEENLRFYARLYDLPDLAPRVGSALDHVGLAARRRDLVRKFSRGMQQRLAIARAILHDPEVLLLDEPHTGLDQEACAMLDDVLRQVTARGRTVVMTSHDLMRAADLASRIDILARGRIAASLPRAEFDAAGLAGVYRAVTRA